MITCPFCSVRLTFICTKVVTSISFVSLSKNHDSCSLSVSSTYSFYFFLLSLPEPHRLVKTKNKFFSHLYFLLIWDFYLFTYSIWIYMCVCVRVCSISCTWINAYRVFHYLHPWIQSWRRDSVTWSLARRLTRSTINLVLHFRLDCAAVQTFPLDYLPLTFIFCSLEPSIFCVASAFFWFWQPSPWHFLAVLR